MTTSRNETPSKNRICQIAADNKTLILVIGPVMAISLFIYILGVGGPSGPALTEKELEDTELDVMRYRTLIAKSDLVNTFGPRSREYVETADRLLTSYLEANKIYNRSKRKGMEALAKLAEQFDIPKLPKDLDYNLRRQILLDLKLNSRIKDKDYEEWRHITYTIRKNAFDNASLGRFYEKELREMVSEMSKQRGIFTFMHGIGGSGENWK